MKITTINYWNNNNKMKIIVLMILTLTLMMGGMQSKAAEQNDRPYTKVEQSMNVANDYISGEYHFVETYASCVSKTNYITIGYINDANNKSWFLETETLDGKLIERTEISNAIKWAYANSIDDITVAVTVINEGGSYYPYIRFIGKDGKVLLAYKCSDGTTEEDVKKGTLVKCDGKVFYSYPAGNNLIMISINSNNEVVKEAYAFPNSGSSGFLFYDKINDALWAGYQYSNKGRLYDYVYRSDTLSDLSYAVASKKKITREGIGANPSFLEGSNDVIYINYSKKQCKYTYSTGKFETYSGLIDNSVVLDNETKLIYYEDIKSANNQIGRNIYFVNKQGNYDIELFDNDKNTLYVGGNGLDIKGVIHGSNEEIVDAKLIFNNETKNIQIKTNEEFSIHLSSEFLKEGYYDDIYIEVGSSTNGGVMFGEIPNGSIVNYNGIFYDKVDDTLAVERNPKEFLYTSSTDYERLDKTSFLTEDEWKKYKEYISAIDRVNFWLQDGKKNYFGSVLNSKGVGYAYLINKKTIRLNEKFTFNKNDNAYYNYASSNSKVKYNKDVWVSYAPCKTPIVSVSSNDFTNEDVNMTISFDGECADLKAKVHVIKETLDATQEEDLTFDFSNQSSYTYSFKESGIYQISVQAESSFGNKSDKVIKTFKIDKDGPILENIKYDAELSSNGVLWSLTREIDAHMILKDLCGIPNAKQLDKYLWQIDKKVDSHKESTFEASDKLGNLTTIKLENSFLVDELTPILQKPVTDYYKDRCEITLKAFDTESGLEGIYYKIGDEDEKKYENKIVMQRDKYGQHNEVSIYAKDIAGNKTESIYLDINLNDSPEIVMDEEYISVSLDKIPSIKIESKDIDGDDVNLSIYFEDELICSNINELEFNIKKIEDLIRKFDYNESVKFKIVAFDGMDESNRNLYIKKINMMPIYKINTKHINFSNYAEIDVSVYDLDDDVYGNTTCVISSNDVELGTFELSPGDNTIKLKNVCLDNEQEIEFKLINKNYKTIIKRKINFINLEKVEEENLFIKIADNYTNDFYKYILEIKNNSIFYTENAERFIQEDLMIPVCNLNDAKNYVKSGIPVIISEDEITDSDLLNLINENDDQATLCYETGSTVDINPIIFSDYENDFYSDGRGKNRKLNVNFEKLEFENTSDDYSLMVYDPFNNTTGLNDNCKNVNFEKEKLDFEITSSGLYTLKLSEWDEIKNGSVDFSKESDEKTISFYAHKKPTCKLTYEEIKTDGDIVTLKVAKEAKDDDFLSINNGIWKEKVIISTYSFEGELLNEVELDDNSKTFGIDINKNQITKIKYIVTDFGISPTDNRFSFSSLDEIVINKINTNPFADFDYYLENNAFANGYIYRMTNHESLEFKNLSIYNDMLSIYGEREEEYQYELEEFKKMIEDNKDLSNRLTIWNKFGKKDTSISKKLEVVDIDLINVSNLDAAVKGNPLTFDILNAKNKNEIYLLYNNHKIECINDEYQVYVQDISDEMTINIKVYSNRDDSYLGEKDFNVKFTEDSEILDFEITNIYDPWCDASLPVNISNMPAGIIRKGYAFDFEIITKGFSNIDDYIYILPKYYYLDKGTAVPCEIVKYNKGMVHPYEQKILNGGKQIGTLDYLYLDNDDRVISNNEEIYHGKFYLPSDARIKVGDEVLNDGLVLVNFQIIGVSSSGFAFNYNIERWQTLNRSPYHQSGDTAIFALKYSALDDYKNYLKY